MQSCSGFLSDAVRVLVSPLLEIVPTGSVPVLDGTGGVIFTSANGVANSGPPRQIPAYCVGEQTTQAALDQGWQAECLGETSKDLIQALTKRKPGESLLHIGGVYRRGDVAWHLTQAGVETHEVDVYDQRLHDLTQDAKAALNGEQPVVVPLFSPRTARQFRDQHAGAAPLHLIALSNAISHEVKDLPARSLIVLPRADVKTMLDTLGNVLRRVEAGGDAQ